MDIDKERSALSALIRLARFRLWELRGRGWRNSEDFQDAELLQHDGMAEEDLAQLSPLGQRVIDAALRAANEEMWVAPLGPEAAATLDAAITSARENPAGVDLGGFAEYAEDEQ